MDPPDIKSFKKFYIAFHNFVIHVNDSKDSFILFPRDVFVRERLELWLHEIVRKTNCNGGKGKWCFLFVVLSFYGRKKEEEYTQFPSYPFTWVYNSPVCPIVHFFLVIRFPGYLIVW